MASQIVKDGDERFFMIRLPGPVLSTRITCIAEMDEIVDCIRKCDVYEINYFSIPPPKLVEIAFVLRCIFTNKLEYKDDQLEWEQFNKFYQTQLIFND